MIGERIKELIEGSGIPLKEVALKLGMSYQNLFKVFKKDTVDTILLVKLASVLNIPVPVFFKHYPIELSEMYPGEIVELRKTEKLQEARLAELEGIISDKQEIIKLLRLKKDFAKAMTQMLRENISPSLPRAKEIILARNKSAKEEEVDHAIEKMIEMKGQEVVSAFFLELSLNKPIKD